MADLGNPNVRIQVLISRETAGGLYNDALYFSAAEYAALSDEEVESRVMVRVNAWLALQSLPPELAPQAQE